MSLNPVKHTSANSLALVVAKIIKHREKNKGREEINNRIKRKTRKLGKMAEESNKQPLEFHNHLSAAYTSS